MASRVTYNGVPSAQGGNIFEGRRFWVAQRVPMRSTIVNHITSNGGALEKQEKNADFLIADHAKKNFAPKGAYSWKLITDSIDHGIMQVEDRYRIGGEPSPARPAASEGPRRSTRSEFTHAEDVALAKWAVFKQENLTGNAIYQEFENMHPRHTWQSWRNRFKKNLMFRGWDYVTRLAGEELPEIDPELPENAGRPARVGKGKATVRTDKAATYLQPAPPATPDASVESDSALERDSFYSNLGAFYEEKGVDDIVIEHCIQGKSFDLWKLYNAVAQQSVSLDEVVWQRVAEDLGYDGGSNGQTCSDLRRCFQEHLADFFEEIQSFNLSDEEGEEDSESEQAEAHEPGFATAQQSPVRQAHQSPERQAHQSSERLVHQPPEVALPPLPPAQTPRRKRPLDADPGAGSSRDAKRRRRLSRDAEIPSTPEAEAAETELSSPLPSVLGIILSASGARGGGAGERAGPSPLGQGRAADAAASGERMPLSLGRGEGRELRAGSAARSEDQIPSPLGHDRERTMRAGSAAASGDQMPSPVGRGDERTMRAVSAAASEDQMLSHLGRGDELAMRAGSAAEPQGRIPSPLGHGDKQAMRAGNAAEFQDQPPSLPVLKTQQSRDSMTASQQLISEAMGVPLTSLRPQKDHAVGSEAPAGETCPQATETRTDSTAFDIDPETSARETHPQATETRTDSTTTPQANTKASRRRLPPSFALSGRRGTGGQGRQPRQQGQEQAAEDRRSSPDAPGSNERQIREVVEHYESLGYANHIVVEALKRTTMTPGGLAGVVMQSLKEGKGVPANYEGIWTDRDDEVLLLADRARARAGELSAGSAELRRAGRELDRLVRKHGEMRIELRRRFLEAAGAGEG